jgi:23S rRNA (guanosine2251-2'-O)-methyltransferase
MKKKTFKRPCSKKDIAENFRGKKKRPNSTREPRENFEDDQEETLVIIGKNPVLEVLKSDQAVDKVLILKDNQDHVLKEVADRAKKRGIVVQTVEKQKLDFYRMADSPHQGCVAFLPPFPYSTIDDILDRAQRKGEEPLIVVLDHLTDPHNLGAIIRSANVCGAHGVIIPKRRSATLNTTSVKASSGAVAHTPVVKVNNLSQTLESLKEKGFWVVVADMAGTPYHEQDFKGKIVVAIGSEGKGVGTAVRNQADFIVAIPNYGEIDSLNASNAAAIILAEAAKQRH